MHRDNTYTSVHVYAKNQNPYPHTISANRLPPLSSLLLLLLPTINVECSVRPRTEDHDDDM